MQRTADFHHKIADARLPEAACVVWTIRQRLTLLLTCSMRTRRREIRRLAAFCTRDLPRRLGRGDD
jgi:hypothetical protein